MRKMCDNACEIHAKKGQTMTSVLIENVSPEFLPKLKAIAKAANAEFKRFVADTKTPKAEKAEKAAKTKALKPTKPKKTAKARAKTKENYTLQELDEMPFMQNVQKWEQENPKEAKKAHQAVLKKVAIAKKPEFYELENSPAFKKGLKMLKSLPKHEQNAIRERVESQMYGI